MLGKIVHVGGSVEDPKMRRLLRREERYELLPTKPRYQRPLRLMSDLISARKGSDDFECRCSR